MGRSKCDSDVGRRLEERVPTRLIAELVSLSGLQQVCVQSLSPHGAGLLVDHLPGIGSEVVIAWPSHDISGTVAWADGQHCGIAFSPAVSPAVVEEILRTNGGTYIDSLARASSDGSFWKLGKI